MNMHFRTSFRDPYTTLDQVTGTRQGAISRILTMNDIFFWGGDAFISVVLALFIVTFIEGATVQHVGIAFMIRILVQAVCAIPIGKYFDAHKGLSDEVYGLTVTTFCCGLAHVLLGFATHMWEVYLAMAAIGVIVAFDHSSWRILFFSSVSRHYIGKLNGLHDTYYAVGLALCLVLAGFVGESIGYDKTIMAGGFFIMAGSFLPLMLRGFIGRRKLHE